MAKFSKSTVLEALTGNLVNQDMELQSLDTYQQKFGLPTSPAQILCILEN